MMGRMRCAPRGQARGMDGTRARMRSEPGIWAVSAARTLTLAALTVAACTPAPRASDLPYYRTAELTPEWLDDATAFGADMHRVGDFALTNQVGEQIRRADVAGSVYVANFFYTRCTQICPTMRANMGRVAEALGDRVVLLSHSVTPDQDSVEVLSSYAATHGIDAGRWHLLTGDPEAVRRLAADSYFVELDDFTGNTARDLVHTETLVLVDPDGRIRGVYNGTLPYDVNLLIEDARRLVEEQASA